MSRLYIETKSDISRTGKRASQEASASIFWGSAGDSKLAGEITVSWPRGSEMPRVRFRKGETLKKSLYNSQNPS